MIGFRDVDAVERLLLLGAEAAGTVAGEESGGCDPFYRAWLRTTRRALARIAAAPAGGDRVDLDAARGWVRSGEWGDTTRADREMLAFDRAVAASLDHEAAMALADGRAHAEASQALRVLDGCCRVQEAFEEVLMELHGDPDREVHVEAHRSLQAQREQLRASHAAGDLSSARALLGALRRWSASHEAGPGAALSRFLAQVRPAR